MLTNLILRSFRVVMALLAVAVSVALIYRGNSYVDPYGPGLLAPVMCILFAMCLILTTFAMSISSDTDYESAV